MYYKGFTIQEDKMKCIYGNEKFIITKYLVYKEENGEKYFLPDITAFESLEDAKETIDKVAEKVKFEIKYAVDIRDENLKKSIQTLLVTENHDEAYDFAKKWDEENATDTIHAEVYHIDCEELYNNEDVIDGYIKKRG